MQNEVKRLLKINRDELVDAKKAIRLVRKNLKDLPLDEFKKVKEIVLQSHLRPSMRKPGLFQLQIADLDA